MASGRRRAQTDVVPPDEDLSGGGGAAAQDAQRGGGVGAGRGGGDDGVGGRRGGRAGGGLEESGRRRGGGGVRRLVKGGAGAAGEMQALERTWRTERRRPSTPERSTRRIVRLRDAFADAVERTPRSIYRPEVLMFGGERGGAYRHRLLSVNRIVHS